MATQLLNTPSTHQWSLVATLDSGRPPFTPPSNDSSLTISQSGILLEILLLMWAQAQLQG